MLVLPQNSIRCPPGPAWSLLGVYSIPHSPRRVLNPDTGQGCQGQELPGWLERIPRAHRQGMLMFLSRGRGGFVSDLVKPFLFKAHSLTGKNLEQRAVENTHSPHSQGWGSSSLLLSLPAPDPISLLSRERLRDRSCSSLGLTGST